MSIHKAQGQTIPRVKVDLNKVFEKGKPEWFKKKKFPLPQGPKTRALGGFLQGWGAYFLSFLTSILDPR